MTPQDKLLWSAWLQLHGVGQDILDEIDRLEVEIEVLKMDLELSRETYNLDKQRLLEANAALRHQALPEAKREGVAMERLTDERIKRFKQYKDIVDPDYEDIIYGWVEECIAEIETLRKPFTVPVEIPEPYGDGRCNYDCPLYYSAIVTLGKYSYKCKKGLNSTEGFDDLEPGPGCPRYKKKE